MDGDSPQEDSKPVTPLDEENPNEENLEQTVEEAEQLDDVTQEQPEEDEAENNADNFEEAAEEPVEDQYDQENLQNPNEAEEEENLDVDIDENDDPVETAEENTENKEELNETLDTNDQTNQADNHDETQGKERIEAEIVPLKKEVKRKARPNKFADGNLIPEEDDEEQVNQTISPGPPPLEPIGQNLDEHDKLNLNLYGHDREMPGATTPDKMDLTLDDEYQEIEAELKPTREELIAKYQSVVEERDRLQNHNNQLHHKLADYYRKRKSEEAQNQPLFDKSSQEQEQRYLKYLSTIEGLRKQLERERWEAEKEMEDLKEKCEVKQGWVNEDRARFNRLKKETAVKSISVHTGRAPSNKEVDGYMQREQQKELEVISVRLENIKLKNQLKKKEAELKAKEELGEGLHMIDFEQLKIENQTYNEKIEERNEELIKLKKKINNTVQILTHVKEKLQHVFAENEKEKINLGINDEEVKKNRDILNRIKQSRDSLRIDNGRLKQNSGLLGNTVLLRDFEECVDKNDSLESQIEYLKRKHAELILNSKGIKQKITNNK